MTTPDSVTIAGSLVRYLRAGVKRQLSAASELLLVELNTTAPDLSTYRTALARFDEGRTLLDTIGFAGGPSPADVELDLCRWPQVVLRSLETEYDREVSRLQDAAVHGIELPRSDIPALESLLAEIRKRTGGSGRRQQLARSEAQLESQRTRRSRGDG
jgi:hypothetical protein